MNPRTGAAHQFAVSARDRYPAYVAALWERTGIDVPLNRLGVLQLALGDGEAAALRASLPAGATWLDPADLAEVERGLEHAAGAILHPHDGAVNNLELMRALKQLLAGHPKVRLVSSSAEALELTDAATAVRTRDGARYAADRVVLAAGAWATRLGGLPRPLPVRPVRGQVMSLGHKELRHVVYGGGGYAVPRGDHTLVGATSEEAAYDARHTAQGLAELRGFAHALSPRLGATPVLAVWAGLRPMTPDHLPILGPDPERPALLYACGHSRNGILLAPLAAECLAAVALGATPPFDLDTFLGVFAVSRLELRGPASRQPPETTAAPAATDRTS